MMHAVTGLLAEAGCLVTYNGKTFDMPVLETRWLFHRVPPPWTELAHLDMLHLSRRLWRARGDLDDAGCRLVMLEHDLFGVTRQGDVPGMEIPARYFDYIRGGDASLLEPVLHHNRLDLLSLACLTARALRLVREGASGARDPQECLALGRELARLRDEARADLCFQAAAESPFASPTVRADALYALARRLRRARRYHEAAGVWRRLMACNTPRDLLHNEAREALAVHYEHRARNLDAAHAWATDAWRVAPDDRRRDALSHRIDRLQRKMAVHTKGGRQAAFEFEFSLGLDE
jgi:tetratricopeptide (TPR) repeat protein